MDDALFQTFSGFADYSQLLERAASSALTFLQGAPFLFFLVTLVHMLLRWFLAPFLGRAGASLTALALTACGLAVFCFRAVENPAAAWSLVAWAANAAGAAAGEAFYFLRKGG